MRNNLSNDNKIFRIVLPKKGRLKEDFAQVLGPADLSVKKSDPQLDYGTLVDAQNEIAPAEALIQRPGDALDAVSEGVADMAIVGLDTLTEFNAAARNRGERTNLGVAMRFEGVSACSLYIAAPEKSGLAREQDLNGLRFATSYPETLKAWLKDRGIRAAKIIVRDGGVEDTVRLGMADVICDVVQSGKSLQVNDLVKLFRVSESCAVLVQRDDKPQSRLGAMIIDRLEQARAVSKVPEMAYSMA
ncbi:MAG: phosphoribosyltransferase [Micavibrio sp.]|nr:phosphoribosyltransferase [Micavibrio sp.]